MRPTVSHWVFGRVGVAGLVLLMAWWVSATTPALGQEAQPLTYRSSDKAKEVIGATAGQTLATSWDPSAGLALPTFASGRPLFARWLSPMVPGGTAQLALDRSAANGPYDRLFIDTDADGRLKDESPIPAASATKNRNGQSAEFRQVALLLVGSGGTVPYHLDLKLQIAGRTAPLVVATAAGWREGQVTVDGKTYPCVLIDADANGAFNDVAKDRPLGDVIRLGVPPRAIVAPVGKYIQIDGKVFGLEVAQDGSTVRFFPPDEKEMGLLRMPADIQRIALGGPNGRLVLDVRNGQVAVPAGTYRLDSWSQVRKEKNTVWGLEATAGDSPTVLNVSPGQVVRVDIGDPVTATVSVSSLRRRVYRFSDLRLVGRSGERVALTRDGRAGPPAKLRIKASRGPYLTAVDFAPGGGAAWTQPATVAGPFTATLWHPGPFRITSQSYVVGESATMTRRRPVAPAPSGHG